MNQDQSEVSDPRERTETQGPGDLKDLEASKAIRALWVRRDLRAIRAEMDQPGRKAPPAMLALSALSGQRGRRAMPAPWDQLGRKERRATRAPLGSKERKASPELSGLQGHKVLRDLKGQREILEQSERPDCRVQEAMLGPAVRPGRKG